MVWDKRARHELQQGEKRVLRTGAQGRYHTVDHDPFIKSQLASRNQLQGLVWWEIWSRNPQKLKGTNALKSTEWITNPCGVSTTSDVDHFLSATPPSIFCLSCRMIFFQAASMPYEKCPTPKGSMVFEAI